MTAIALPSRPSPAPRPAVPFFGGNMPVARLGMIINLIVPLAILIWDAFHHHLGVNAVNFALVTTGLIAVTYLLLSLVITPLKAITGFTSLIQFRRAIGVYAFYYGCVHLFIYFWWDRARSVSSTVSEITHHWYLMVGFLSLSIMMPLWATSFSGAIRWMGGKKWKLLHRLAYLSAALACYHYYLQSKADKRLPDIYIGVLSALLLWRLESAILYVRRAMKAAAKPQAAGKERFWKGDLRVAEVFRETDNVRTFRLVPADSESIPFKFSAGQFLNLSLNIDGQKIGRSYTIASPPTRDGYIELTIKREDNGKVSGYLHDMMMSGGTVSVSAPAGRFTFDRNKSDRLLLIAGGVGITPVMSILRDLTDRSWPGTIDLVFSARTRKDIIFDEELRYLAHRHPNLHVHIGLTREMPDMWEGLQGRLTADLLLSRVSDLRERVIFICGPDEMAQAVARELIDAGVKEKQIHVESFTPAAVVKKDAGTAAAMEMDEAATATVTFAKSNQSTPLPASLSVLEAAEKAGVEIDYDCRSGICGRCRTKLLSGDVMMTNKDALSDADEKDGYILACQAHATNDVSVDA